MKNEESESLELAKAIGKRIKITAAQQELSMRAMAAAAGISYRSLLNYANGEQLPGALVLEKLSRALNVSLDWLVLGQKRDDADAGVPESQNYGWNKRLAEMSGRFTAAVGISGEALRQLATRADLVYELTEIFWRQSEEESFSVSELRDLMSKSMNQEVDDLELYTTLQLMTAHDYLDQTLYQEMPEWKRKGDKALVLSHSDHFSRVGVIQRCIKVLLEEIAPQVVRQVPAAKLVRLDVTIRKGEAAKLVENLRSAAVKAALSAPEGAEGEEEETIRIILGMAPKLLS